MLSLKFRTSILLLPGHSPFSTKLAVREVQEELGLGLHGYIEVVGVILAVLERLEAVDDDCLRGQISPPGLRVQEQAVPAEAREVAIDGFGGDTQLTGHLSSTHATDGFHEDSGGDFWEFLPVSGGKGLCREGDTACTATETLYAPLVTRALIEPGSLEGPGSAKVLMVHALAVGAVRWIPVGCELCEHVHEPGHRTT